MNRKVYIVIHTLLASFIAPVAFMFLVTGGLYTWGIKGDYIIANYTIDIQEPLTPTKAAVETFVIDQLATLGLNPPTGESSFKHSDSGMSLSWSGANMDLSFKTLSDPGKVTIEVRETTIYRRFVQLHKAKGGVTFKVYASILAISLFLLLVTGYVLAWQLPKYKKLTITTSIVGVLFFVMMVWLG